MASVARFPSLSNVGGHVTQEILSQIPSPPKLGVEKTKTRAYTKNKNTMEKTSDGLLKIDTERYRNSYLHNLCLDMLKEGFHQSYRKLFNLMKIEKEMREKLGTESGLQDAPLVQEQPEKLEQLRLNLTAAEAAKRRGKMDIVYNSYLSLAKYFEQSDDTFLSNHFYKLCLETSVKVRGNGRRKEAEANFSMGVAYEKQGDFIQALRCFENLYTLTSGRLLQMDGTGKNLFSIACECLQRVYTTVALQLKEQESSESLSYLLKAYKVAKQGEDIPGRGEASYILGCAYQDNEDDETALLYHNEYLAICQQLDDLTGMGRACKALAKSYEKQMDVEPAMKHLESFVELSKKSGNTVEQQRACSSLGEMLNSLGKYEEAAAYIEKAYKLGRKVDEKDKENKELVRAEYGIVMANLVMHGVSQAMETTSQRNISKLLNWKQIRKDVFSNELPISNVCSNENLKDKNVGEIAACYSVQNDAKDNVEMSSNDTIP